MNQTDGVTTERWLQANPGIQIIAYLGNEGETDSVQQSENSKAYVPKQQPEPHREEDEAVDHQPHP